MAEEDNLNGLAGTSTSTGANNAAKQYARTMKQEYWGPAQQAAAAIRRDMSAAENATRAMARNLSSFDGGNGGGTGGGLGYTGTHMTRPTFSVNSSGVATPLSTGTDLARFSGGGAVMRRGSSLGLAGFSTGGSAPQAGFMGAVNDSFGPPQRAIGSAGYYQPNIVPYGGGGGVERYQGGNGWGALRGAEVIRLGLGGFGGGPPSNGGGAGGAGGFWNSKGAKVGAFATVGVLGALASYGDSQKQNVYLRDFMANQYASQVGGSKASNFYQGLYGGALGQTSYSDFAQGAGMLSNLGYLPNSSQFSGMVSMTSKLAQQTGYGFSGAAGVLQNLSSANVVNRSRAMLGINTLDSNGVAKSPDVLAKQIMGRLYTGKGPITASAVKFSQRQGGGIDYALDSLGLDPDTKAAVERSMVAQAQGGGGLASLTAGRAVQSALKKQKASSDTGALAEGGAVRSIEKLNTTITHLNDWFNRFINSLGLGGALGSASQVASAGKTVAKVAVEGYLAKKIIGKVAKKFGTKTAIRIATEGGMSEAEAAGAAGAEVAAGTGLGAAAAAAAPFVLAAGLAGVGIWGINQLDKNHPEYQREQQLAQATGRFNQNPAAGFGGIAGAPASAPSGPMPTGSVARSQIPSAAYTGSDGASGSKGSAGGGTSGSAAVSLASKFLGVPYKWGGNGPGDGGFDCSGLVKYVYGKLGVNLPRTANEQSRCGSPVASLAQALPGDLLFWFNGSNAHHVAIYIGGGRMIAAPHTGTSVQVQNVYGNPQVRRVLGASNKISGNIKNILGSGSASLGSTGVSQGVADAVLSALQMSPLLNTSATGTTSNMQSSADLITSSLSMAIGGAGNTNASGSATGGGLGKGTPTMKNGGGAPTAPANVSGNVALAKQLAASYGWGSGPEWDNLYATWQEESGFNNNNQNPTSTAYGIAQFLDSTWAGTGYKKTSDPRTQILAGLKYIKNRYGDPIKEWAFHKAHNYYAQGSFEIAQDQDARVHAGEMIIPADRAKQVRQTLRQTGGANAGGTGGGGGCNVYVYAQTIDDAAIAKVVSAVKAAHKVDNLAMAMVSN